MNRRTKIVCTLGPAVNSRQGIASLIEAGMNVARFNCSHGDWDIKGRWATWIRECESAVAPIAIMVDLQGPKFRIGPVPNGSLEIHAGAPLTIGRSGESTLQIERDDVWEALAPGDSLLLGDGEVQIQIDDRDGDHFNCTAQCDATVRSRQGLTIVGKAFDTPALTEQDRKDVASALDVDADFIAMSYVRRASDLRELRLLVDKRDTTVRLVAKIETKEALDDLDDILRIADVVMVARGDLGLQMALEEVPVAQKKIIRMCNAVGVPVITATQMLESMMHSPRPTRAEASDVANAILDGTDAVMLSAETATGEHAIEATETMSDIAIRGESLLDHDRLMSRGSESMANKDTDAVANAAVHIAASLNVQAIVTTSSSGVTPVLVSRYRPAVPIWCVTWHVRTQRQMAMVWGVEAVLVELSTGTDESIQRAIEALLELGLLKAKDKIVVTAGVPVGAPGRTNLILVQDV